jgi:hypothetical protein
MCSGYNAHSKMNEFMKNITRIIFCLLVAVAVSCKKIISVGTPSNKVTIANIMADSSLLDAALRNIYISLDNYEGAFSPYNALYTDDLVTTSAIESYTDYQGNTVSSSDYNLDAVWKNLYSVIYQSNAILAGINSSTLPPALKQRVRGEADFLRAYSYFYLVNTWGDVPLLISPDVNSSALARRSPSDSVYTLLLQDLKEASASLPASYQGGQKIRATRWAAMTLLARASLYKGDYENAMAYADSVIRSGMFSLVSDFSQLNLANSSESILQVWNQNGFSPLGSFLLPYSSATVPTFVASPSLMGAFEVGDERLSDWIASDTVSGVTYYYVKKYNNRTTNVALPEYTCLLRLAEPYLVRAEAEANLGQLSEATADINLVRERAGLPDLPADLDLLQLMAAILHERQVEFFTENGQRFFDLKRYGLIDNVLGNEKPGWKSDFSLYPIPLQEVTLVDAPIKMTTSGRSKLTSYFAGEDFLFKYVSS